MADEKVDVAAGGPPARGSVPPPGYEMPRWIPRAIVLVLVAVAGFFFAWWAFHRLKGLLVILLVSLFLALAIEPAVNWLAARGMRRGLAAMLVFVALFAASVGFMVALGSLLYSELSSIADSLPDYANRIVKLINDTFGTHLSAADLQKRLADSDLLGRFGQRAATNAVDVSTSVLAGLFKVFTVLLFGFYLSADGPKLRRYVVSLFPPGRQGEVLRAWEIAIDKTGSYIYSRLLVAFVSFVAHYVFLTLLGLPYAFALAAWVGLISQFIPTVGTYLAGALPVLVALAEHPLDAVWIVLFVIVYQQVENYLVQPRISAKTLQVHPAVAFGAVLAGAALLGPVGAFIGIPMAASAQAFFASYVRRYEITDPELAGLERIQQEAHHRPGSTPARPAPDGPAPDGSDRS